MSALLLGAAPVSATSLAAHSTAEMRELRTAAGRGDVDAMVTLGEAWYYGLAPGFKSDRAAAIYWFELAAEKGSAAAQRELGSLYEDDVRWPGVGADDARAYPWYGRAAQGGDYLAQARMVAYCQSPGPRQDYRRGHEWAVKAALQGVDYVVWNLKSAYVFGDGVSSFDEAASRLEAQAQSGSSTAQWQLSILLATDEFGKEDRPRALALIQQSAGQEDAIGLYFLALYTRTDGEDAVADQRAQDLLRRSADKGFALAQLWWSRVNMSDDRLSAKDDATERLIFDWVQAAAEKGYSDAQDRLANYYSTGKFVPVDRAEAYKWYFLAHHLPYHHVGFVRPIGPHTVADEVEGKARADAWLTEHPKLYWEIDE